MSTEDKSSVTEIINSIATELAKNELNFKEKQNEDQTALKLLAIKIDENRDIVSKSINSIYKSIKDTNIGIELPKDLKIKVAEHISQQVFENNLTSGAQIDIGNGTSSLILEQIMIESLGIEELEIIENTERLNDKVSEQILDDILKDDQAKEKDKLSKFTEYDFNLNNYSSKDFNAVNIQNEHIEEIFGSSLSDILERANNGDKEAQYQILLFQNASLPFLYPEDFKNMSEKHQIEYLEGMMMIADSNIPEMKQLYKKMAEKAEKDGYIFFDIDENGNKIPSIEKLQDEYKKHSFDKKMGFDVESGKKAIRKITNTMYIEFSSTEDFYEENKIQAQYNMLQEKLDKITRWENLDFENKEELLQVAYNELKELSKNNLDASLRVLEERVNLDKENDNSKVKKILAHSVVEALIEVNNGKIDFVQDEYIEKVKLDLYKGLLIMMQRTEKIDNELIGKMKEADSKLANIVSREFGVKTIDEFCILPKKEQPQEKIKIELGQKETISDEKKRTNIKNIINNMNNSKGINFTQNFITNQIRIKNKTDKNNFIQASLDVLEQIDKNEEFYSQDSVNSRKELFSEIIGSSLTTEEDFKRMSKIDSKISKEILQELLENQSNSSFNTQMRNTIILLGKSLDSEKSSKQEEHSIFKVKSVLSNGVSLFNNDIDGQELE